MTDNNFYLDANRRSKVNTKYSFKNPSLTQQCYAGECDINNIIKQYSLLGYTSQNFRDLSQRVMSDASKFTDASFQGDLLDYHMRYEEVQQSFVNTVPAKIRERFSHDPMAFYRFVSDPKNMDAFKQMFGSLGNFSVPTADQLSDANPKQDPQQ
ncbi:minor capsid protein [Capybara microvirus Cap3_SP_442]|nr:minor capsid protein [Capybara microvirus Cap3_SP_442]